MTGEAPDVREQEDCPSGKACGWSCDQHEPVVDRATGLRAMVSRVQRLDDNGWLGETT